jgi:hypothetical protein
MKDLEYLVATGWGATQEGGYVADTLQKVSVPYVPNYRCANYYGYYKITDGMMCAGTKTTKSTLIKKKKRNGMKVETCHLFSAISFIFSRNRGRVCRRR